MAENDFSANTRSVLQSENSNQYIDDKALTQLWHLDGGMQAQAGVPFYHKPGYPIKVPTDTEDSYSILNNKCLCKFPCKRWYPVYQHLVSNSSIDFYVQKSDSSYTHHGQIKATSGYQWELIEGGDYGDPYKTYYAGLPPMTPGKWHPVPELIYGSTANIGSTAPSPSYILNNSFKQSIRVMYVCDYNCHSSDSFAAQGTVCAAQKESACGEPVETCDCDCETATLLGEGCYCGRLYYNTLESSSTKRIPTTWIDYQDPSIPDQDKPAIPDAMRFTFDICQSHAIVQDITWDSSKELSKMPKDLFYEDCDRVWKWESVPCTLPYGSAPQSLPRLPNSYTTSTVHPYIYKVQGDCRWYYYEMGTGTKCCLVDGGSAYFDSSVHYDCRPEQQTGYASRYAPADSQYNQEQQKWEYVPKQEYIVVLSKTCTCDDTQRQAVTNPEWKPVKATGWGVAQQYPCNIPQPSNDKYITVTVDTWQKYKIYKIQIRKNPGSEENCFIYNIVTTAQGSDPAAPGWALAEQNLSQQDVLTKYILTGKIRYNTDKVHNNWNIVQDQADVYQCYTLRLQEDPVKGKDIDLPGAPDGIPGYDQQFCQESNSQLKHWYALFWWCNDKVPQYFTDDQLTYWNGFQGPRSITQTTSSTVCAAKGSWQDVNSDFPYTLHKDVQTHVFYQGELPAPYYNGTHPQPIQQPHRGLNKERQDFYYRLVSGYKNPCDDSKASDALLPYKCNPNQAGNAILRFWQAYDDCIVPLSRKRHAYRVQTGYACYHGGTFAGSPFSPVDTGTFSDSQSVNGTVNTIPSELAQYLFYNVSGQTAPEGPHIGKWNYLYDATTFRYPQDRGGIGFLNSNDNAGIIRVGIQQRDSGYPDPVDLAAPESEQNSGLRYFYTVQAYCHIYRDEQTQQPIHQIGYNILDPVCGSALFYTVYSYPLQQICGTPANTWPPYKKGLLMDFPGVMGRGLDDTIWIFDQFCKTEAENWRLNQWIAPDDPIIQGNNTTSCLDPIRQPILPVNNLYNWVLLAQDIQFCGTPTEFQTKIRQITTYQGEPPQQLVKQCRQPWYPFKVYAYPTCNAQLPVYYVTQKLPCVPSWDFQKSQSVVSPQTNWTIQEICGQRVASRVYTMNAQRSEYGDQQGMLPWSLYPLGCPQYDSIQNPWPTPEYRGQQPSQTILSALTVPDAYLQRIVYAYSKQQGASQSLVTAYSVVQVVIIPKYICQEGTAVLNPAYQELGQNAPYDVAWDACRYNPDILVPGAYQTGAFFGESYIKIYNHPNCLPADMWEYNGQGLYTMLQDYLLDHYIAADQIYTCPKGAWSGHAEGKNAGSRFWEYQTVAQTCRWNSICAVQDLNKVVFPEYTCNQSSLVGLWQQKQKKTAEWCVHRSSAVAKNREPAPVDWCPAGNCGCGSQSSCPDLTATLTYDLTDDWADDIGCQMNCREHDGSPKFKSGSVQLVWDKSIQRFYYQGTPTGMHFSITASVAPALKCAPSTYIPGLDLTFWVYWRVNSGQRLSYSGVNSMQKDSAIDIGMDYAHWYCFPSGSCYWQYGTPACYDGSCTQVTCPQTREYRKIRMNVSITWSKQPCIPSSTATRNAVYSAAQQEPIDVQAVNIPDNLQIQPTTDIQNISVNRSALSPVEIQQLQTLDADQTIPDDLPSEYLIILKGDK